MARHGTKSLAIPSPHPGVVWETGHGFQWTTSLVIQPVHRVHQQRHFRSIGAKTTQQSPGLFVSCTCSALSYADCTHAPGSPYLPYADGAITAAGVKLARVLVQCKRMYALSRSMALQQRVGFDRRRGVVVRTRAAGAGKPDHQHVQDSPSLATADRNPGGRSSEWEELQARRVSHNSQ